MATIWCYNIECKNCINSRKDGKFAEDREGKFGICKLEELVINRNARCEGEYDRD